VASEAHRSFSLTGLPQQNKHDFSLSSGLLKMNRTRRKALPPGYLPAQSE